jgi:hypothetical protein
MQERDKALVKKYPKLYAQRHKSMQETCMCWGFEIGEGWMSIIESLSALIQNHINGSRRERARHLKYKRLYKRAMAGDTRGLEHYYNGRDGNPTSFTKECVARDLEHPPYLWTAETLEACPQVIVTQVKEKFGGLRFYYCGGDSYINGAVQLAEYLCEKTCEECGNPATHINQSGWMATLCENHARPRNE